MRTTAILSATMGLLITALATPAPIAEASPRRAATWNAVKPTKPQQPKCMTVDEAQTVAGVFQQLIQGYTKDMAEAVLTEDFVDYSSAVSITINKGAAVPKDITQPIFTSRAQFMEGHGKQKPIPFETTHVWHSCEGVVSMRWITSRSAFGQPTEAAAIPVPGLVILETVPSEEGNEYAYRIHTIYSEYNSAAWLVNLGVFGPVNATTPVPAGKRSVEAEPEAHWWEAGML